MNAILPSQERAWCATALYGSILLLAAGTTGAALGQEIPLVYDVENTGVDFPAPPLPPPDELPVVEPFTDPFEWSDGSGRDASFESWSRRRSEIQHEILHYEIGPKPPADPDDVIVDARYAEGELTVKVFRPSNGTTVTFESPVYLPRSGTPPYPVAIQMAASAGAGSGAPASIFESRGIVTMDYLHDQATTYGIFGTSKEDDPYYLMYPENLEAGQYSAWAWGVSRLIDGLYIAANDPVNPLPIALDRIAVTGCSYAGKMALFAGALDERVALTIPVESGGGGLPAWRTSHRLEYDGEVEKIDNTDGSWFLQSMKDDFRGDNVYRLPHDHHELLAMVAPRALFITGNTDFYWLSNKSASVAARAAGRVYETFGIGDRIGVWIDGGHFHCFVPNDQVSAMGAFVDKFMLGDMSVDTEIRVTAYPEVNHDTWTVWWGTGEPTFGDLDQDGAHDLVDNCTLVPNNGGDGTPPQCDSNQDGYGNACDGDLDDDGLVDFPDLELLRSAYYDYHPDGDLDCDGAVDFGDLPLMREGFFGPPGPRTDEPVGWPDG